MFKNWFKPSNTNTTDKENQEIKSVGDAIEQHEREPEADGLFDNIDIADPATEVENISLITTDLLKYARTLKFDLEDEQQNAQLKDALDKAVQNLSQTDRQFKRASRILNAD